MFLKLNIEKNKYKYKTKSVHAGNYHSIVIGSDNELYSWGRNNYGQLGDGTNTNKLT